MSNYSIFLRYNSGAEGFQIPVNPETIEITDGQNSKQYDISQLGEINVLKSPSLREYSFSSFFPARGVRQYYVDGKSIDPFITSEYYLLPMGPRGSGIKGYVDFIKSWMIAKRPVRFIIASPTIQLSTPASIEKFQWKEVAGSGGDIEYTITLREYVFYAAKPLEVAEKDGKPVVKKSIVRPNERQIPETYKLVAGDSLFKIAKMILGDDSRWRELQKLNNIPTDKLRSLPIGMVIKLPKE